MYPWLRIAVAVTLGLSAGLTFGQTLEPIPAQSAIVQPAIAGKAPRCNPWALKLPSPLDLTSPPALTAPGELTWRERACFHFSKVASPTFLLRATLFSAIPEIEHKPNEHRSFSERFESYYARKSAQQAAELLVGALHHEDPRPRSSTAVGNWNRLRSALASVVETTDASGGVRPAFAPMAGALSSGFTGMAFDNRDNAALDALRRSGFVYSQYFVRAVFREFKPEVITFSNRIRHKK